MAAPPVIMAAGMAMQAIGSIQQGRAARDAANYNAAVMGNNAVLARQSAAAESEAQMRKARQVIGGQRTAIAKSGVVGGTGTPLDLLASSVGDAETDRMNILYGGELRARGFQESAIMERRKGEDAYRAGLWGAGSSLLMAGGQAYKPGAGTAMPSSTYDYRSGGYPS